MIRKLLLLTILLIGCSVSKPTIESANLTGFDIPEYVDQRVWDFMPEKEGIERLSIVYVSNLKTETVVEDVEVCYKATADDDTFYGLIARVEGQWFVGVPSEDRKTEMCPVPDEV